MAILFNKTNKEFHIYGRETSYIFAVLENGQLGQLYYGKKVKHRDSFSHLLQFPKRRVGAPTCNIPENKSFSLELLKQEYPSFGGTDCRQPAIKIAQPNGSRITNFVYKSHTIYSGKKELEGLPATYVVDKKEATTVEIKMFDEVIN